MFVQDFVRNGRAYGEVSEVMAGVHYDPLLMRPYWDYEFPKNPQGRKGRIRRFCEYDSGQRVLNAETGTMEPVIKRDLAEHICPIANETSLRKDEWILLDMQAKMAYRQRLRAWSDLVASATYGGFDGMSKMILEHETTNDPGSYRIDMDGVAETQNDTVLYQLEGLPLPVIQSGFQFTRRRLAVSQNGGMPLNVRMAEAAGRRVSEALEKLTLGTETGPTWGVTSDYNRTPTVYGYTNFGPRITSVSLTTPTTSNSQTTVDKVLQMRQAAYDARCYGPFILYHSDGWDQYLDNDHYVTSGSGAAAPLTTLRRRLEQIEGITSVRRLDFFTTDYQLLLIQMNSETARAVIGLPPTLVQWESKGGMQMQFKYFTIQVPQLFADYENRCGIVHATT